MAKISAAILVAILNMTFVLSAYGATSTNNVGHCRDVTINKQSMTNMIVNFNDPQEWRLWRTINDGVMGGKSQGAMQGLSGYGTFSGYISLANNGGFSSVVRKIKPLSPGVEQLSLDVAGDGLTYQLRAIVYINGYRLAYKHNFQTDSVQRQQMIFSLSDFDATFRGRIIPNPPPLLSENIAEIGLLITNKRESHFNLDIFSISSCTEQVNINT